MKRFANVFWLGLKEFKSLASDPFLVGFIVYAFTLAILSQAKGVASEVNNASIAFVDEDQSMLSKELIASFFPPRFQTPQLIQASDATGAMDRSRFMFIVAIPPMFEEKVRKCRPTEIQVNIDATAMNQAGTGSGYINRILNERITTYVQRSDAKTVAPLSVVIRKAFNPNGDTSWFMSVVAMINQITTLTLVLTGAALIREREHGTIEHLLTLPLSPIEIALAKVWANSLIILIAVAGSFFLILKSIVGLEVEGSPPLFLCGVILYLFFTSALGLFLGTVSQSMAQFALLIILVSIVLQLLSGGNTPVESQPQWMQNLTMLLPSRHFVAFSQAIIFRGAGIETVWPQFLAVGGIGLIFLWFSLTLFRRSISVSK